MPLKILAAFVAASLCALSGCASTSASSNTTYAQIGNSGPSAVSVPLN